MFVPGSPLAQSILLEIVNSNREDLTQTLQQCCDMLLVSVTTPDVTTSTVSTVEGKQDGGGRKLQWWVWFLVAVGALFLVVMAMVIYKILQRYVHGYYFYFMYRLRHYSNCIR